MRTDGIVERIDDLHVVEVVNEPTYTFGSTDNVRRYQREELLDNQPRSRITSRHGVVVHRDGKPHVSVVIGTGGGVSGVHEHSLALVQDRCFIAVGPYLVSLGLPDLPLQWVRDVDSATCFGVYLTPDRRSLICHGELEISRLSLAGDILWQAGGRDIFTGDVSVDSAVVVAVDFNGDTYTFDVETGTPR